MTCNATYANIQQRNLHFPSAVKKNVADNCSLWAHSHSATRPFHCWCSSSIKWPLASSELQTQLSYMGGRDSSQSRILLDRGTCESTTCPRLLPGSGQDRSRTRNFAIISSTCYCYTTKPHRFKSMLRYWAMLITWHVTQGRQKSWILMSWVDQLV